MRFLPRHAFARPVSRACGGLQRAVRPPWLAGSPRRTARTREGLRVKERIAGRVVPTGRLRGRQSARTTHRGPSRAPLGAPSCKGQHCTTEVSLTMYASRTCAGRPRPLPPSGTRTAYARRCNSQLHMTPPRAGGRWRRHWAGCTVREYTPHTGADAALAGDLGLPPMLPSPTLSEPCTHARAPCAPRRAHRASAGAAAGTPSPSPPQARASGSQANLVGAAPQSPEERHPRLCRRNLVERRVAL